MFTSLSISSARSELWAAGRISRPPRVFVCMHIYAIDEFTSLPLRWLNLPLSIVTAPLPHLHAHPRDASLNLWPSVCEPLRLGSSSSTYVFMACVSQIFSFPAFLCLCDWSSSARSNYNLSVLLCKQHILHLHSWAVILTWRLMMIIVAHHWTTMRFNLQTLSLTSTD